MGISGAGNINKILFGDKHMKPVSVRNDGPINLVIDTSVWLYRQLMPNAVNLANEVLMHPYQEEFTIDLETDLFQLISEWKYEKLEDPDLAWTPYDKYPAEIAVYIDYMIEYVDIVTNNISELAVTILTNLIEHNPELSVYAVTELKLPKDTTSYVVDALDIVDDDYARLLYSEYFTVPERLAEFITNSKEATRATRAIAKNGIYPNGIIRNALYDAIALIESVHVCEPYIEADFIIERLITMLNSDAVPLVVLTNDSDIVAMSYGVDAYINKFSGNTIFTEKCAKYKLGRPKLLGDSLRNIGLTSSHIALLSSATGNDYTRGIYSIGPKFSCDLVIASKGMAEFRHLEPGHVYPIIEASKCHASLMRYMSNTKDVTTVAGAYILLLIGPIIERLASS